MCRKTFVSLAKCLKQMTSRVFFIFLILFLISEIKIRTLRSTGRGKTRILEVKQETNIFGGFISRMVISGVGRFEARPSWLEQ